MLVRDMAREYGGYCTADIVHRAMILLVIAVCSSPYEGFTLNVGHRGFDLGFRPNFRPTLDLRSWPNIRVAT